MSALPAAKNEPEQIKLRRYRDTLITGGMAIIGFGLWSVVKVLVETIRDFLPALKNISIENFSPEEAQKIRTIIENNTLSNVLLGIIIVILAIEMIVLVYVGLSARAVGLQKKKKNGKKRNGIAWLILGLFLVAISVYSTISSLVSFGSDLQYHSVLYLIISIFVDATTVFVLAELVFTGFRLRSLSKKLNETEEVPNAA